MLFGNRSIVLEASLGTPHGEGEEILPEMLATALRFIGTK
jgi:hypothetical protein